MRILLKKVKIIAPGKDNLGEIVDILITDGRIQTIKADIVDKTAEIFEEEGARVSIGWMDIGTYNGEPGFEDKEDLSSLANAAAAGGYTAIASFPNTQPSIQSKSEIQFILQNTAESLVDFHPIGAISIGCAGQEMAELYDMHNAGAVAFSDGQNSLQSDNLMLRSLRYIKAFDGLIINQIDDKALSAEGQMHEGLVSTSLGLRSIPTEAETLMLHRDILLAAYADTKILLHQISAKESITEIQVAKEKGLAVSASVPALNLVFTDEELWEFDTNYKVFPPLRTELDRQALIEGLKAGTIDIITSNHRPLLPEEKQLEFPYANFGTIGLETTFASCRTVLNEDFSLELLIEKLAHNPREVLQLPIPEIKEGAVANLTLFHPNKEWIFTKKDIYSRSHNTAFIQKKLKGKVLGVINNKQYQIFSYI